jgi:hypothetical protein
MKSRRLSLFAALVLVLCVGPGLSAQTTRQLTTTLLPMPSQDLRTPYLSIQNNPPLGPVLKFDLNALPLGLKVSNFVRVTLRLVAKQVVYDPDNSNTRGAEPVTIAGRVPNTTKSICSLSTISDKPEKHIALQSSGDDLQNKDLRDSVYGKYSEKNGDKILSIQLFTDTRRASSAVYSLSADPSNVPRLVIDYTLSEPSLPEYLIWGQKQHDPEHTGRSPWLSVSALTGFTTAEVKLPPIGTGAGSIADYPLTYNGNIYLIYEGIKHYLVCLDFTGKNKLWEKEIGTGAIQRSPAISPQGVLFAVTENQIAAYDLNKKGELVGDPYPLSGKLSDFTDLTVANDGSLFLALKENKNNLNRNYIYGFTSKLIPFLKAGPFEEKISSVTVNRAGNAIFAQTVKGAVVINLADPSKQLTLPFADAWEYYHSPVAAPEDVMIFSDFTQVANKGNVRAYGSTESWKSAGTLISQPVIGVNRIVYFIQGGKLQGRIYNAVGPPTVTGGNGLNTTSNLVMDGGNNVYFWNNGALNGYEAGAEALFTSSTQASSIQKRDTKDAEGPEKFIRLMLDPGGTVWVNNKGGNVLFAFQPVYAQQNLTVSGDVLARGGAGVPRLYRATDNLTVAEGAAILKTGSTTLFQAGSSISFPRGFQVEPGASLLCRTGR